MCFVCFAFVIIGYSHVCLRVFDLSNAQSVVAVNYCSNGLWWQSIGVLIASGGSQLVLLSCGCDC